MASTAREPVPSSSLSARVETQARWPPHPLITLHAWMFARRVELWMWTRDASNAGRLHIAAYVVLLAVLTVGVAGVYWLVIRGAVSAGSTLTAPW